MDLDFWRYKLPGLRLANYEEGPRRCALGMAVGSVVWDIYITVTEDGRAAREAYWAKPAAIEAGQHLRDCPTSPDDA